MSAARLDQTPARGHCRGPASGAATAPAHEERPWPVVLLTALRRLARGVAADRPVRRCCSAMRCVTAPRRTSSARSVLGVAIFALRQRGLPLFVEQLLTPALIVGAALLGLGPVPRPAAAAACGRARARRHRPAHSPFRGRGCASFSAPPRRRSPRWPGCPGTAAARATACSSSGWPGTSTLLLWLAAGVAQRAFLVDGAGARLAAALESLRAGWLLATLGGLAWWSGMTFLVGGTLSARAARRAVRARSKTRRGAAAAMAALRIALAAARRWLPRPGRRVAGRRCARRRAPASRSCSSPSPGSCRRSARRCSRSRSARSTSAGASRRRRR